MSLDTARRVLRIEAQAIQDVLARLDAGFDKAVDVLFACKGRVVVTGMGKSGLIGRKISATLSSTGTPSFFLHAAEAGRKRQGRGVFAESRSHGKHNCNNGRRRRAGSLASRSPWLSPR